MTENNIDKIIEMVKGKVGDCDLSVLPDKFSADFHITDAGIFSIEVLNGKITVSPQKCSSPDIAVQTTTANLKKIINQELSLELAFFTRRVIVSGNLQKAMFIRSLFK